MYISKLCRIAAERGGGSRTHRTRASTPVSGGRCGKALRPNEAVALPLLPYQLSGQCPVATTSWPGRVEILSAYLGSFGAGGVWPVIVCAGEKPACHAGGRGSNLVSPQRGRQRTAKPVYTIDLKGRPRPELNCIDITHSFYRQSLIIPSTRSAQCCIILARCLISDIGPVRL
jgi:hypothetical protein